MRKVRRYLPLGVVDGAGPTECGIRRERRQERVARVEPLARTAGVRRLADDAIEECRSDYICHRHIIGGWGRVAGALLAPRATVIVPGAAIAVAAAAEVRRAPAILGGGGGEEGEREN